MINRDDFIKVVCDNRGKEFMEQIAQLQAAAIHPCPRCAAALETNVRELDTFIRDEAPNEFSRLRLHVVE